jgi:hypothetical protein
MVWADLIEKFGSWHSCRRTQGGYTLTLCMLFPPIGRSKLLEGRFPGLPYTEYTFSHQMLLAQGFGVDMFLANDLSCRARRRVACRNP